VDGAGVERERADRGQRSNDECNITSTLDTKQFTKTPLLRLISSGKSLNKQKETPFPIRKRKRKQNAFSLLWKLPTLESLSSSSQSDSAGNFISSKITFWAFLRNGIRRSLPIPTVYRTGRSFTEIR